MKMVVVVLSIVALIIWGGQLAAWAGNLGKISSYNQAIQAAHPGLDFHAAMNEFLVIEPQGVGDLIQQKNYLGAVFYVLFHPGLIVLAFIMFGFFRIWGANAMWHTATHQTATVYRADGTSYLSHNEWDEDMMKEAEKEAHNGLMATGMGLYLWPMMVAWTMGTAYALYLVTTGDWQFVQQEFLLCLALDAILGGFAYFRKSMNILYRILLIVASLFNFGLLLIVWSGSVP